MIPKSLEELASQIITVHWQPFICFSFVRLFTYYGSLDKLLLAGLAVLLLAPPGFQCGGLQGPAEREGEGPGFAQGTLVNGAQIDGGLLLALASR